MFAFAMFMLLGVDFMAMSSAYVVNSDCGVGMLESIE